MHTVKETKSIGVGCVIRVIVKKQKRLILIRILKPLEKEKAPEEEDRR